MHYVTELWFDLKTEDKLKSAWAKLAARGITNDTFRARGRPHVSLTSTNENPVSSISVLLDGIGRLSISSKVRFDGVKRFPGSAGIVFLKVILNDTLVGLHCKLCSCLHSAGFRNCDYFEPDSVVFHTTLAVALSEQLYEEIDWAKFEFPVEATIERIAVVEYEPARTLREWNLNE